MELWNVFVGFLHNFFRKQHILCLQMQSLLTCYEGFWKHGVQGDFHVVSTKTPLHFCINTLVSLRHKIETCNA